MNPYLAVISSREIVAPQMFLFLSRYRFFAFFLVVTLLTARIGAVSHHAFVEPIQNFISKKAVFVEEQAPKKSLFFKSKRCVSELISMTGPAVPAGSNIPVAIRFPPGVFQAIPEIYLDIFIPPDPAALS